MSQRDATMCVCVFLLGGNVKGANPVCSRFVATFGRYNPSTIFGILRSQSYTLK